MNINEGAPLQVLDSKSNGLTFDPFGKFLASQSSEEKSVKIWRVQNFRNITLEHEISAYYKQSMGMSIYRRLSWSSDGSFISTTGGRVCGEYLVPLLERSTWQLIASLSGHRSSINISRINPRLYKTGGNKLDCYSIVAIVSQDSTISVWKPQLTKPFAVMMDFCMMGVTDLSWGFNGNILLSSSHDGKVAYFHFKPGTLGEPCTEFEKREIIKKRYGNQVLQDYIKNATTLSQQKSPMNQLPANSSMATQEKQLLNQAQKVVINEKTGKKKIVPKFERIFGDSGSKVNPHLNPFIQLNEATALGTSKQMQQPAATAQGAKPGLQAFEQASKMKDDFKEVKDFSTQDKPLVQNKVMAAQQVSVADQSKTKLPSMSQIQQMQSNKGMTNMNSVVDSLLQNNKSPMDVQMSTSNSNINQSEKQNQQSKQDLKDKDQSKAALSASKNRLPSNTLGQSTISDSQNKAKVGANTNQASDLQKNAPNAMVNKHLSSSKELSDNTKMQASIPKNQSISNQDLIIKSKTNIIKLNQSSEKVVAQSSNLQQNQPSLNIGQLALSSSSANEIEFFHSVQQMFSAGSILTSIPLEQYKALFSYLLRDEIEIGLPKDERDVFGEDLKVAIQSLQLNNYQQKINIKVYDEEAQELSNLDLNGERVVLVTGNRNFFAIYTNKQLMHIFSSQTVQLIKRGILIEGVCMIQHNQNLRKLVLLTFKGQIIVYDVIDSTSCHINDEIKLADTIDVLPVLQNQETERNIQSRQDDRSGAGSQAQGSLQKIQKSSRVAGGKQEDGRGADEQMGSQEIFIKSIQYYDTDEVEVFLSNYERFVYQIKGLKQWRKQVSGPVDLKAAALSQSNQQSTLKIQPSLDDFENPQQLNVNDIQRQQKDTSNDNLSKLIDLLEKINEEELEDLKGHEDISEDQNLLDLQELVSMYENLGMRNEFLKALHNYSVCVFQKLDLNRIKDLLMRFNLLEGITKEGVFQINKDQTLKAMLSDLDDQTLQNFEINQNQIDQIHEAAPPKKSRNKLALGSQKTFCGLEKMQIFKKIILPVLKTIADGVQFNIVTMIQKIVISISEMDQAKAIYGSEQDVLNNKEDQTMRDDGNHQGVNNQPPTAPQAPTQKHKNDQEMSGQNQSRGTGERGQQSFQFNAQNNAQILPNSSMKKEIAQNQSFHGNTVKKQPFLEDGHNRGQFEQMIGQGVQPTQQKLPQGYQQVDMKQRSSHPLPSPSPMNPVTAISQQRSGQSHPGQQQQQQPFFPDNTQLHFHENTLNNSMTVDAQFVKNTTNTPHLMPININGIATPASQHQQQANMGSNHTGGMSYHQTPNKSQHSQSHGQANRMSGMQQQQQMAGISSQQNHGGNHLANGSLTKPTGAALYHGDPTGMPNDPQQLQQTTQALPIVQQKQQQLYQQMTQMNGQAHGQAQHHQQQMSNNMRLPNANNQPVPSPNQFIPQQRQQQVQQLLNFQPDSEQVQGLLQQLGIDIDTVAANPKLIEILQTQIAQMNQQ